MKYQDQLKTPMWQERRLYVLKRDDFTCTMCNQYGSQVHAHHNYYEKGRFTNHSLIHIITGLKLLKELPASPSLTASAIGNMFSSRNEFRETYENFKTDGTR